VNVLCFLVGLLVGIAKQFMLVQGNYWLLVFSLRGGLYAFGFYLGF
jgi:hypothetical protein